MILAFAGVYGYNVYRQNKIDSYNSAVYEIQVSTQQKMAKLDTLFQEFVASSGYAKVLAPKFEEAASITKRAALALRTLDPPKQYEVQHKKLIEIYSKGSDLYSDLYELANYIRKRDGAIQSLIKELKSFSEQMSDAANRLQAMEIAKKAEGKIESVLKKLKQLRSPIKIYDNKLLVNYIEAISRHLRDFEEASADNSTYRIQLSLYNIQVDFSQNWQRAFFSADKKAINSYNQRVKRIQALYDEISN